MFGKVGVIGQSEAGYHLFGNIAGADKVYLGLDYRIGIKNHPWYCIRHP
jgi:hypothetical protein